MDKALATNAFYIPNVAPGRYTFMWEWNFNSKGAGDTYTSCWEADIVADKNARNNKLNQRRLPVRDPDLLHGKSLAPPMKGGPAPVQPQPQQPQTQRPVTQPPRQTRPRPNPVQPQQTGNN